MMDVFTYKTMGVFMNSLADMIVPLGICVILPVIIVWLGIRHSMNETNKRTEIVLAAINKNSEIDVEDFLKKISKPKKSLKEKLLQRFKAGCILIAVGIFFALYAVVIGSKDISTYAFLSGLPFLIGCALLVTFFVSKKTLAEELEAESKDLRTGSMKPGAKCKKADSGSMDSGAGVCKDQDSKCKDQETGSNLVKP